MAGRRRIMRRPILAAHVGQTADGGPRAAILAVLEDRAQAAQRLGALALQPAAHAHRLDETVGERRRAGLDGQRDAGGVTRRLLELVDAAQPGAVVLAGAPGL